MEFTKIRHDSKGKTTLEWHERRGKDLVAQTLESKEPPRPEFLTALQSFIPIVVDLLGVPELWAKDMTIRSVALKVTGGDDEDDGAGGREGIVITAVKTLDGLSRPLVINTPLLQEGAADDDTEEAAGMGRWTDELTVAIGRVKVEAKKYADGERAQLSLTLEKSA